MITKNTKAKTIGGVDIEEYFTDVIGPMAASILEKLLFQYIQTEGQGMTGPQIKMVQFAIERSYGAATRQVNHVRVSDQEIAAQNLEGVDPEILRRIAGNNAPRLLTDRTEH